MRVPGFGWDYSSWYQKMGVALHTFCSSFGYFYDETRTTSKKGRQPVALSPLRFIQHGVSQSTISSNRRRRKTLCDAIPSYSYVPLLLLISPMCNSFVGSLHKHKVHFYSFYSQSQLHKRAAWWLAKRHKLGPRREEKKEWKLCFLSIQGNQRRPRLCKTLSAVYTASAVAVSTQNPKPQQTMLYPRIDRHLYRISACTRRWMLSCFCVAVVPINKLQSHVLYGRS